MPRRREEITEAEFEPVQDDLMPPEGEQPADPPDWVLNPKLNLPRAEWTVKGKPIPDYMDHLILWSMTDQGQRQADYHRVEPSGAKVVRDEWHNTLEKRANLQPWESPDILAEAAKRVHRPGFKERLLSPNVIQKRGKRGWEFATDQKTGERVTVGDMILGEMPIDLVERRNEFYASESNGKVTHAAAELREAQERMIADAHCEGISPLRANDRLSNFHDPQGEEVAIGSSRVRGRAPSE